MSNVKKIFVILAVMLVSFQVMGGDYISLDKEYKQNISSQISGARVNLSWVASSIGLGTQYGGVGVNFETYEKRFALMAGVGSSLGETMAVGGIRYYFPVKQNDKFLSRVTILGGQVGVVEYDHDTKARSGAAMGLEGVYLINENFFTNFGIYSVNGGTVDGKKFNDITVTFGIGSIIEY
jgi:hypothetical protein